MVIHPHHRRLSRHARHIIRDMLKARVARRAGTLQVQVRQLDSAVSLHEDQSRLHPDDDRFAPGVRVALGPETRSLLRQLLESRDLRHQQQLVREIRHQVTRRVIAAVRRIRAVERTRELAGKAVRGARKRGGQLARWLGRLPARTRDAVARSNRARVTQRTSRHSTVTRTRIPGPETREMLTLGRTARSLARRTTQAAPRTRTSR